MLKHFLKNAVQANLDLRKPVFSFLNSELFDLRNFYYWIWKSVVRKKCLMLVNFQVEIFLKSRFHCNRILARSFFKIRIDNNDKSNVLIAFNIPFSSRLNQDLTQTKSFSLLVLRNKYLFAKYSAFYILKVLTWKQTNNNPLVN